MRQETIQLYKLAELPEKVQTKVMECERNTAYENIDMSCWEEDTVYKLEEMGFSNPKLSWDLSYCQGSHVSFSSGRIVLGKLMSLKELLPYAALISRVDFKVNESHWHRGAYHVEFCIDDQYDSSGENDISVYLEKLATSLTEQLEEKYKDLCEQLMKEGYAEIEYQTSDENIKESLDINEVEFTADGVRY